MSLENIHIGLSYISAFLKSKGHIPRLAVLDSETPDRSFAVAESIASEWRPSLVAFTAVSTQYPFVTAVAARLKQRWPDTFLLIGGVHASFETASVMQDTWDAACVGEGEYPTAELIAQLEAGQVPHGIPNLWLKQPPGGTVEKNACRNFLQALDEMPFPDREIWHPWVRTDGLSRHVVQPSRGCPFRCSYCSNHALSGLAGGKYTRLRAPEAVVEEIRELKARYPGATDVYLQSETIALNIKWLTELSQRIKAFNDTLERPLAFACNFRITPRIVTDEVFDALAQANVRTVEIGLESGSERLRRDVLRRDYSNDDFSRAVTLARRHGMRVNVYNLIGIPGETPADHALTIEANHRACPDRSLTSIFFPYPGTDLYKQCVAQRLLQRSSSPTTERRVATLDLPTFSKKEIQRAYDWFEFHVYRGHRPLLFRLRKVVSNKINAHPWIYRVFMRLLPVWHALQYRQKAAQ
jgi:radical SAM superfamily enzyme YgiQ (UPF0313 family)